MPRDSDSTTPAPAPHATAPAAGADTGRRARLSDQLYRQIFDQIVSGQRNVGDKLPSENELSEQHGMSRPVVREALMRLRADGLITAHQGLGSFVSAVGMPVTGTNTSTSR